MDNDHIFSLEEIHKQLQAIGYNQIPKSKLNRFAKDLNTLAKHERQRNSIYSDSSTMTTPSSNPPSNDGIDNDDHYHHNVNDIESQLSELEETPVTKRKTINIIGNKENFSQQKESADNQRENINRYTGKPSVVVPYAGKPILKRKVLRKYNGESYVFDESATESEAGSNITDDPVRTTSANVSRIRNSSVDMNYGRKSSLHNDVAKSADNERIWTDYSQSSVKILPSFIRPSSAHPHTRNLKKTDPVAKYHRYANEWKSRGIPGERNYNDVRWQIREQLVQQQDPPKSKPQHFYAPNDYIVPTDKKRKALRWEIRAGMA